jgi:lipoyl-dependent peroxiredoxin subunit D
MKVNSVETLREQLPDYARDIKLNLGAVLTPEGAPDLSEKQIWMVALASAYATKVPVLWRAIEADAANYLSESEQRAARSAATLMAMNNVYYRFVHLLGDAEIKRLPARLRMNGLATHGIAKFDFEAMSLAVSAINACGMCIESHVHELRHQGATPLAVQSIARIAAVLAAAAQGLSLEQRTLAQAA